MTSLRVVFLCAGYGTRLQKDLAADDRWKHLTHLPKALLPVASRPLLSIWTDMTKDLDDEVAEILVVTNDRFRDQFEKWAGVSTHQSIDGMKVGVAAHRIFVVSDGTTTNETRVGAIGDMLLGINMNLGSNPDRVLIVAGDTLFKPDFNLKTFLAAFRGQGLITECETREEEMHLRGIIEFDDDRRVRKLLEKPSPDMTPSRSQSPCFYLLDRATASDTIQKYLESTKEAGFAARDATGNFLAYLVKQHDIFCFHTSGRYDIGNLKNYLECSKDFN